MNWSNIGFDFQPVHFSYVGMNETHNGESNSAEEQFGNLTEYINETLQVPVYVTEIHYVTWWKPIRQVCLCYSLRFIVRFQGVC